MLAIIGGAPMQFRRYVDLYHRALEHFGKPEQPVGVHSPGYVAATDEQALDEAWPHYVAMQGRIGRERGWRPMTREQFERDGRTGWRAVHRLTPRPSPRRSSRSARGWGCPAST